MARKLTKAQQAEREESLATLREMMPEGSTVYMVLRHVSKSGMSRDISPLTLSMVDKRTADFRYPWWHVAKVLGMRAVSGGHDAVRVEGGGMDMGFHLADCLSRALYGKSGALTHRWI